MHVVIRALEEATIEPVKSSICDVREVPSGSLPRQCGSHKETAVRRIEDQSFLLLLLVVSIAFG